MQSKQQLYIDRLHLISQRIRRNELFQQKSLTSTSDAPSLHLTDIQSLKGVVGARKVVLACISHSEDGRYTLEDHSGQVPLDLSNAQTAAGFFTGHTLGLCGKTCNTQWILQTHLPAALQIILLSFNPLPAENCIVIAEGEMRADGVFHATAVGFPPCEPRENLPMAAQRLNFFGGPSLSSEDTLNLMVEEASRADDRMLVLSNVHLDQRSTLDALNQIFTSESMHAWSCLLCLLPLLLASLIAASMLCIWYKLIRPGIARQSCFYPKLLMCTKYGQICAMQSTTRMSSSYQL
eukprot:32725-Chlamydomonas_euryale.AAC.14